MKKIFVLILALALFAGCFSGCAAGGVGPDPGEPVTLTMWHNYGGDMQQTMDLLIDEFNSGPGKEQGVRIDVTAISSGTELGEALKMIANGDPGAPDMPDIFTGYPKLAVQLWEKNMLADLDNYFTAEELSAYVDAFIAEGRLADGGLYVFPVAKSTEILYLNQTLFDAFSAQTGADGEKLSTFEGIAELAREYYRWTDAATPELPNDGRQFYAPDSWFNVAEVGMVQLGGSILDSAGAIDLGGQRYAHIFATLCPPAVEGGFALYDGYSSDLSKTGDLVCSTGSSAGILFYGDTITHSDGSVEPVEYSILPYPTFAGGERLALQRGGGLLVARTDEKTEYAAALFIKWLTAAEQNMRFVSHTGYLPVTRQAFERDMPASLDTVEDSRIRKMLTAVLSMYESYEFFTPPNTRDFDTVSRGYEKDLRALMTSLRSAYLAGESVSVDEALKRIR